MSVALYREGDTHTVRGVRCEMTRCDHNEVQAHLDAGWSYSVPGEDAPEEDSGDTEIEGLSLPALRELAREAGIENCERLKTAGLRKALNELES